MSVHPLAGIGAAPVSESEPCGVAVRYDADFEALEAEVSKQEALTPEPVDWPEVNRLAAGILQSKSKDLLVAAYLSRGLLETDGYAGLAAGLQVLRDLLADYWEGLFPPLKRARARATAVQWLAERAAQKLSSHPPGEKDDEFVLQAESLLREIDGALVEHLSDDAPNLTELSRPLRDFKRAAEARAKPATPAPAPAAAEPAAAAPAPASAPVAESAPTPAPAATPTPAASRTAAAPAPAAAVDVGSEADVRKALRAVQDTLRKTAGFLLQARVTDARAYRLNRIATWLMIDQAPPNQDNVTQLVVVPEPRRKQLQQMFDQSQFSALLPELEQTLSRASFWLDGQRMAATALQGMGAEAGAARAIVVGEVRQLLTRVPGLEALKFSDQTPFADEQTRLWLDAEVMAAEAEGGEGSEAAPWQDALVEARSLLAGGDAKAAFGLFDQGVASAAGERERFHWRIRLGELLVQAGRYDVAIPLLNAAADRASLYRLDEWEPRLAADVFRLLYEANTRLHKKTKDPKDKGSDARVEAAAEAYAMLCRLDPARAIALQEE